MISHSKPVFIKKLKKNSNFILFKKINSKKIDPIHCFLRYASSNKYGFVFESVEKEIIRGRFTICGYNPQITIEDKNKKITISSKKKVIKLSNKSPLDEIKKQIKNIEFSNSTSLPSMASSFFGYFGYETINYVENISKKNKEDYLKLPDSILFLPEIIIIHDNKMNKIFIASPILTSTSSKNDYDRILSIINKIELEIKENNSLEIIDLNKIKKLKPKSNINKKEFIKNINKVKNYINNGDIFQTVISQRFEVNYKKNAQSLYQVLRKTNPSPFMFMFNFPNFKIIGSSPEILVRVNRNKVTIRPIAGTRIRGKNKKVDKANEIELLSDKKELAEHLMLLDLGRNDTGKVSIKNSVRVTKSFFIERYSHVMHIVSNVEGLLKKTLSSIDALMSGFPAGTVSGAPKIRAMEIIDELENSKRGVYAGGIGYISTNNELDTCIALRTGVLKDNKLYVQAGAGIVYDSDPLKEYEETINKAKAIFTAAEISLGNNL